MGFQCRPPLRRGRLWIIPCRWWLPSTPGNYRGNWKLQNAAGVQFYIGTYANNVFGVEIAVSTPYFEAYDFVANMCSAHWHYNGGPIPCPFKESVQQYSYVKRVENPILENGSAGGAPALLTVPLQKYNGIIMGVFPVMEFSAATTSRPSSAASTRPRIVTSPMYELDYLTPNNDLVTIWKFREKYDGFFYCVDVDLSKIASKKDIRLVLKVSASGPAFNDRALWIASLQRSQSVDVARYLAVRLESHQLLPDLSVRHNLH